MSTTQRHSALTSEMSLHIPQRHCPLHLPAAGAVTLVREGRGLSQIWGDYESEFSLS